LAEEENNSTRARVLDARPQLYGNKQFSQADKALRQALPLVKGDNQLEPVVLFQLGGRRFSIGKGLEEQSDDAGCAEVFEIISGSEEPRANRRQNNVKAISSILGPRR
jgi:hypothetical protein